MKTAYARFIGVDVASKKLDISDSMQRLPTIIENDLDQIKRIIAMIGDKPNTLVICEATGNYEYMLVDLMHDAGIAVVIANPRQVRDFAKGHGFLEKSDSIDARMIRMFGEQVDVPLARQRTADEKRFHALSRRRLQLLHVISQEENRLRQSFDKDASEMIRNSIEYLKTQLKQADCKLKEIVIELSKTDPKVNVIKSVPGVGFVTTATLLTELPELGTINREKIAKLVGVAPMIKQSGSSDKKRQVRGGRSNIRRVIYMATLVGTKSNPIIKNHYQHLLRKGKPKKLALVACMRKLLTILNDMVRRNEEWNPEKKRAATALAVKR